MEILLKRNYLVFPCTQESKEWVTVELESGEREHVPWLGFCADDARIEGAMHCYLCSNGWRQSFNDSWNCLETGEFIAGLMTDKGVFAIYGENKPMTCFRSS